jgi:integrase
LIEQLVIEYLEYAEGYYVDAKGTPNETFGHCKLALAPVIQHYGKNVVSDFTPLSLVFIRDQWVEAGYARPTINRWATIIKQMFRWGVTYQLVGTDTLHALDAVPNLKAGRTTAPEHREIQPVPMEIVEKTLPFLPEVVADMVRVQLLAGMRPQDVRNLRSCDIDRSEKIWKYRPFTHKTKHRGKIREVAIGPKAQAILLPYILEKEMTPEMFLFSPQDSVRLKKIEKRENRKFFNKKGEVQPSQLDRSTPNPKRQAGDQYTKDSYNRAIQRACIQAGVESWSPNQLRHTAGTLVRDQFGLEVAQAVLGHASAKTTEIYAQVNFEKAAKAMAEIG